MPHSIKIRGIAPPDVQEALSPVQHQFWQIVTQVALKVKDRELAEGLDAYGDPLKPISARTRKYRRSAMTPSGKGDPSAPPLMPARQKSRVRSLLAGRAFATHAELYWRFDPFSGGSFDEILTYQRAKGRDVFGISPDGMEEIRRRSWREWEACKKKGLPPVEIRTAFASAALKAGPQTRIARVIAGSALPNAGARPVPVVGNLDTRFITRGIGAPFKVELKAAAAAAQRTGSMTGQDWRRYYTQEVPRPKPPTPRAAAVPKPPKPPTHSNPIVREFLAIARAAKAPVRVIDDLAEAEKRWKWLIDFLPTSYNWVDNVIYVNPHALHWKDPSGFAAMDEVGWFSGSDVAHAAHHEIGHYRHAQAITPEVFGEWVGLKPRDAQAIAREVSGYAATNRVEFVAEVYSGLKGGKVYSPEIMALYRRYKGPEP